MTYNRLMYDKCAYDTEIKESTGSLNYNLFRGKYENTKCAIADYTHIIEFGDRARTENELYGLSRLNSLCPNKKFSPKDKFENTKFSPTKICENIYCITPSNLIKPTSNMLNRIDTSIKLVK